MPLLLLDPHRNKEDSQIKTDRRTFDSGYALTILRPPVSLAASNIALLPIRSFYRLPLVFSLCNRQHSGRESMALSTGTTLGNNGLTEPFAAGESDTCVRRQTGDWAQETVASINLGKAWQH